MKVVAFNGSARKDGNTASMIRHAFKPLRDEGIDTEMIQLCGEHLWGCTACYQCFSQKNRQCAVKTDILNHCIEKMLEADAILLASPTYFADITTELKALIDRAGMVARANDSIFKRKIGAAIVTARRGGAIHAFDSINHFFFISEMIVPGSNYWNMGYGRDKGEVEKDNEALLTMTALGQNIAWLLKKLMPDP